MYIYSLLQRTHPDEESSVKRQFKDGVQAVALAVRHPQFKAAGGLLTLRFPALQAPRRLHGVIQGRQPQRLSRPGEYVHVDLVSAPATRSPEARLKRTASCP